MNTDGDPDGLRRLRSQAEKKFAERMERLKELSTRDVRDLIHELGTHQIELEMQNEELRRVQDELEASRNRYAELYDLAPIGYFTFNPRGLIKEVNLTGAKMLGVLRSHLSDTPFAPFLVNEEDLRTFRTFYKRAFTSEVRQSCELRIKKSDKIAFPAQLQGMAVENIDNKAGGLRVAMIDITERKAAEEEREGLILEKMNALSRIKTLNGLLPICMNCKKIRDDEGYWNQLESYIRDHSEAEFSHGLCPECSEKLYPEYFKRDR